MQNSLNPKVCLLILHFIFYLESSQEFLKPATPADHPSPAGWTAPNLGPAGSTHKVTLATLVDLGTGTELFITNLDKTRISTNDYFSQYYYRTLGNLALDTLLIGFPHRLGSKHPGQEVSVGRIMTWAGFQESQLGREGPEDMEELLHVQEG